MQFREVEAKDWEAVIPVIQTAIDKANNPLQADADIQTALAYFITMAQLGHALVIDDTYLVIYQITDLPFTTKHKVLTERLIARINPEGKGSLLNVFKFLAYEKQYSGASYVMVGDLMHPDQERYGRLLTRLGLRKANTLYVM